MHIDSRFDKDKPFDVIRAEDLGDDLYEFYEPLQKLMRDVSGVDIEGSRPVFLIGGRGTGKTMVLKFLSLEMQLMNFIKYQISNNNTVPKINKKEAQVFLRNAKFIGIYLHFRVTEYGVIREDLESFFIPYLSLKIAEQLIDTMQIFKLAHIIHESEENEIIRFFMSQIKMSKLECPNSFESTLNLIRSELLPIFELIFEKSSYMTLSEITSEVPLPLLITKNIIFGLPNLVFNSISDLRGKRLFILLDEFEFLDDNQMREVSKLVKDSDETSVVFKIGSRYMPSVLQVGKSNEVLQELHDFRQIDITKVMNEAGSGKNNNYNKLIKNILNKRLRKSTLFAEKGLMSIDQLFPNLTLEEEARILISNRPNTDAHWSKFKHHLLREGYSVNGIAEIIRELKYPENPIKEKLNMLLFYRGYSIQEIKEIPERKFENLYRKNSLNLLIQLYSDYRIEKRYVGIDVFIYLSSGIIRYAIELCNQALTTVSNFNYSVDIDNPVSMMIQDMSAKFQSDLLYADIEHISGPGNFGFKVQRFINDIGTIFRALHANRYLPEPEPTHFETNYADIVGNAKKVFDSAVEHSYLQQKNAMEPRSPYSTKLNDYVLNRIFSPKFRISYRVRGRTYISADQIIGLIEGDEVARGKLRMEIVRKNSGSRLRNEFEADENRPTNDKRKSISDVKRSMLQKTLFDISEDK